MRYIVKPSDVYESKALISTILNNEWDIIDFRPPTHADIFLTTNYCVMEHTCVTHPRFILKKKVNINGTVESCWE